MDFDDNGIIKCDCCHGDRLIEDKSPKIYKVCPNCKGKAGTDWVSNAMDRKPGLQYLNYSAAQQNIMQLIDAIKQEGLKIGQDITITIQCQTISYEPRIGVWVRKESEIDESIKLKILKSRRDKCTE